MDIPLTQFSELPVSTTNLQDIHLIAVSGNVNTVRVPAATLYQGFVVKASSAAIGTTGDIFIGSNGLYSQHRSIWRKSPSYHQSLWGDLTDTTRFLRVDDVMSLTDTEKSNARSSIGVDTATQTAIGLVKGSDYVTIATDGSVTVNIADPDTYGISKLVDDYSTTGTYDAHTAATPNFVQSCVNTAIEISNKTIASNTSIGIVMGGTSMDSVNVDSTTGAMTVPLAIVPGTQHPGLTYLAHGILSHLDNSEESYAAPVSLVKHIVDYYVESGMTPAKRAADGAAGVLGAVTPMAGPNGNIMCSNDNDAFIYVRSATNLVDGTVIITPQNISGTQSEMLTYHSTKAATLGAVGKFVSAGSYTNSENIAAHMSNVIATSTQPGVIKSSATVRVNSTTGVATVPYGSSAVAGVVKVHNHTVTTEPAEVVKYSDYAEITGPASATSAGRVKVANADGTDFPTTVSYEDFVNRLYLYAGSATAGFIQAVSAAGSPELGLCPTAITTDYWKSAYASTTKPGITKVYGADGLKMSTVPSLSTAFSSSFPAKSIYNLALGENAQGLFYFDCSGAQYKYPVVCYNMGTNSTLTITNASATSDPEVEMIPLSVFGDLVGEPRAINLQIALITSTGNSLVTDGSWTINDAGGTLSLGSNSIYVFELSAYMIDSSTSRYALKLTVKPNQ